MDYKKKTMTTKEVVHEIEMSEIRKDRNFRTKIKKLQPIDSETLSSVMRILGHHESQGKKGGKQRKWYGIFYLDPMGKKNAAWDLLIIIVIYLFQLQISLTLGFGPEFWSYQFNGYTNEIAYGFLVAMMCIDVVVNFHKGYYAFGRGKVIDDPELIIKHYLKIYFIMDITCTQKIIKLWEY